MKWCYEVLLTFSKSWIQTSAKFHTRCPTQKWNYSKPTMRQPTLQLIYRTHLSLCMSWSSPGSSDIRPGAVADNPALPPLPAPFLSGLVRSASWDMSMVCFRRCRRLSYDCVLALLDLKIGIAFYSCLNSHHILNLGLFSFNPKIDLTLK